MSVDLKTLSNLLIKVTPNLATAILGHAGGIVVTLIEHYLGVSETDLLSTLSNDPNAAIKLKALELKHGEVLAQIEYEDRSDARHEAIEGKYDWFVHLYASIVGIGFFYSIWMVMFYKGNLQNHDILNMLLGIVGTSFIQVLSYYFGNIKK